MESMCTIDYLTVDVKEYTYQITRGGKLDGGTNEILKYSNRPPSRHYIWLNI